MTDFTDFLAYLLTLVILMAISFLGGVWVGTAGRGPSDFTGDQGIPHD